MHYCLQIAEIQERILSFLAPSVCTVLARTCRAFYEPAMDVVWADVDCFHRLIKCMPSDVWVEREPASIFYRSQREIVRIFTLS